MTGMYDKIWEELEYHHKGTRGSSPRTINEYRTAWKEFTLGLTKRAKR
jgi:hypothetical protein